jgi:hypothetical protein
MNRSRPGRSSRRHSKKTSWRSLLSSARAGSALRVVRVWHQGPVERHQVTVQIRPRPLADADQHVEMRLPGHHLPMSPADERAHHNVAHPTAEQPVERARPTATNNVAEHGDAGFDVDQIATHRRPAVNRAAGTCCRSNLDSHAGRQPARAPTPQPSPLGLQENQIDRGAPPVQVANRLSRDADRLK